MDATAISPRPSNENRMIRPAWIAAGRGLLEIGQKEMARYRRPMPKANRIETGGSSVMSKSGRGWGRCSPRWWRQWEERAQRLCEARRVEDGYVRSSSTGCAGQLQLGERSRSIASSASICSRHFNPAAKNDSAHGWYGLRAGCRRRGRLEGPLPACGKGPGPDQFRNLRALNHQGALSTRQTIRKRSSGDRGRNRHLPA